MSGLLTTAATELATEQGHEEAAFTGLAGHVDLSGKIND